MTQLRPIEAGDLDRLKAWRRDPDAGGEYQWFGYLGGTGRMRELFDKDALIEPGSNGTLAVADDDGALVGDVSWTSSIYGPIPATSAWSIGIIILSEHRGKGHGSVAQRLLVDYLFAHTPAHRIEASTDIDNVAEQRALDKAGFTREGVLRGAQFRRGQWRDMVLFSKLRGEP